MSGRVARGATIRLYMYLDSVADGVAVDPDVGPTLTIKDPADQDMETGVTTSQPDSHGNYVVRSGTGTFYFDYEVDAASSTGIWSAYWVAEVYGAAVTGTDYFEVVTSATISFQTDIIERAQRDLKTLTTHFVTQDYIDALSDSEGDVGDIAICGLDDKWSVLWWTKRLVRHLLQRLLNVWLLRFDISKAGKSLSLSTPARTIMARIDQIDRRWDTEKEKRIKVNGCWQEAYGETVIYSDVGLYEYRRDWDTGRDFTKYREYPDRDLEDYYFDDMWADLTGQFTSY